MLLLPLTGLMVIASPLGGKVAARVGPRPPIVVGLGADGDRDLPDLDASLATTYAELWLPTAIMGFGIGLALTPMNLAAMNAVRATTPAPPRACSSPSAASARRSASP